MSTQIAILADVHGNLPALEAVMDDLSKQPVDHLWYLGDFLGYIPFPNEVIQRLRAAKALSIIGNYDQKVLAYPNKKKRWRQTKKPAKLAAFRWNYRHLRDENKDYLQSLPETRKLNLDAIKALLSHGSPESIKEPLSPETAKSRLQELANQAQADLVVCGHSHLAFERWIDDTYFINPGSVGRPGYGDPRAAYCRITIEHKQISTCMRRVNYDTERAAQAIQDASLDPAFATALKAGQIAINL